MADTLTLTTYDVKFGTNTSLTSGNELMSWNDTATYTNWYMEFSLTGIVSDANTTRYEWAETITTSSSTSREGLSAMVFHVDIDGNGPKTERAWTLAFGKGGRTHIDSSTTLTFNVTDDSNKTSDALTFAVYEGYAYIGNKTTKEYITVNLSDVTFTGEASSSMTSGEARAFANSQKTPISNVRIASLDALGISENETLDMGTLVTSGVAVTKPVPEPTTATLSLLALAGLAARRRRR